MQMISFAPDIGETVSPPRRSRPQNAGKEVLILERTPLRFVAPLRLFPEVPAYQLSNVVVPLSASQDRLAQRAGRCLSRSPFTLQHWPTA